MSIDPLSNELFDGQAGDYIWKKKVDKTTFLNYRQHETRELHQDYG